MRTRKLLILLTVLLQTSCMISSRLDVAKDPFTAQDSQPPAPPQIDFAQFDFKTSHFGIDSTPEISWQPARDEGGSGLNHYEVAVGIKEEPTSIMEWTNIGLASSASFKVSKLERGVDYYFSVVAVDAAGNKSTPAVSPGWKAEPKVSGYENTTTLLDLNGAVSFYSKNGLGEELIGGGFTRHHIKKLGCAGVIANTGLINDQFYTSNDRKKCQGTIKKAVAMTVGADRLVVIAGSVSILNGQSVSNTKIYRTYINGDIDSNFQSQIGTGFSGGQINDLLVTSDGKILVAGEFTSFNGINVGRIARLNSNGSLDTTFNVGSGFDAGVNSIYEFPNTKIAVGGRFTKLNGATVSRYITLLNSNGSIDSTFASNAGTGFNQVDTSANVTYVGPNSSGQILVTGRFTGYNTQTSGVVCASLLNIDGTLDATFRSNISAKFFSVNINKAIELPDSSYLFVGGIYRYNGQNIGALLKVNRTSGATDTTFMTNINTDMSGATLNQVLLENSKIYLIGSFNSLNGNAIYKRMARINLNGSVDTSFAYDSDLGFYTTPSAAFITPESSLYVMGPLEYHGGSESRFLIKTTPVGAIDLGFLSTVSSALQNLSIFQFMRLPDDRTVINGYNSITYTSETPCINDDGSACSLGASENLLFESLGSLEDGSFVVRTDHPDNGDINIPKKFLPSAAEDTEFTNKILTLSFMEDYTYNYKAIGNKVYVIGDFEGLDSTPIKYFFRLNSDGSPDALFNSELGQGFSIESDYFSVENVFTNSKNELFVVYYKSNDLVRFDQVLLPSRLKFAKLTANGKLDITYLNNAAVSLETTTINGIKFLPDDRAIIYGSLKVNGNSRSLVRLNADGSVDLGFDEMTQFSGPEISDVLFDKDDNLVVMASGLLMFKNQVLSDRYLYKFKAK